MSRVDAIESSLYPDDSELISGDGVPLETPWHRAEIGILIDSLTTHWRDREDFYVGGNMFIYFSAAQARNRDYRGPDFYLVQGVPRTPARPYWAIWKEQFRYPDLIIELTSPSTADEDRTVKKALYEQVFRTREYFLHDPDTDQTDGWRLDANSRYQPIIPDERGRFRCESAGLWLGPWVGTYAEVSHRTVWLRFFTDDGEVVPVAAEEAQAEARRERERADDERRRADDQQKRADDEQRRANDAGAEIARLRALLAQYQRPGN